MRNVQTPQKMLHRPQNLLTVQASAVSVSAVNENPDEGPAVPAVPAAPVLPAVPAAPATMHAVEPSAVVDSIPISVRLEFAPEIEERKRKVPLLLCSPPEDMQALQSFEDLQMYNLDALKKIAKQSKVNLPKSCTRATLIEKISDVLFEDERVVNLSSRVHA
jgi:hypothetical protein